ncbi:MAG: preprotein translocase subunit YajC [Acetobacteraceae bacterium]
MLISPAYASGFDIASSFGSISQFMPLVLMLVVFYFLLIRPQQVKQKELRAALAALKRGDKVVTGGGIIGVVQKVSTVPDKAGKLVPGSEVEVEIAPNTRVTVLRETITSVIRPQPANDSKPASKAKAG